MGLAARMKGEKTRSLKKGKRQKAEEEIKERRGVFQTELSAHIEKTWGKRFILERGIGKEKQYFFRKVLR